jgi:hypothetical protein
VRLVPHGTYWREHDVILVLQHGDEAMVQLLCDAAAADVAPAGTQLQQQGAGQWALEADLGRGAWLDSCTAMCR